MSAPVRFGERGDLGGMGYGNQSVVARGVAVEVSMLRVWGGVEFRVEG